MQAFAQIAQFACAFDGKLERMKVTSILQLSLIADIRTYVYEQRGELRTGTVEMRREN
jgi:hypothetical protein